jgi:sugar lactone lactonase YvrE
MVNGAVYSRRMRTPIHASILYTPESEALRFLPEGPRVLQHDPSKLGWIAIQHGADATAGSINILDLANGVNRSIALPGRPGFFAETAHPGIVVVGLDRRLVVCDLASGAVKELSANVTDDPSLTINDGLAVDGGILFGTKHIPFRDPIASVYFFDLEKRQLRALFDGQTCSNGKVIVGSLLIDIDSAPKTIHKYELSGRFEAAVRQGLVTPASDLPGFPDGMRPVDSNSVVVAFYNPAPVREGIAQQLDIHTGEVLCEWVLPGSPRVTCPEIAMIDGQPKILFTTADEGMPPEIRALAPHAGCLYIADVPVGFTVPDPPPLLALSLP